MRAGGEPECLVDFWMQDTLREIDEAAAAGRPPPVHTDDEESQGPRSPPGLGADVGELGLGRKWPPEIWKEPQSSSDAGDTRARAWARTPGPVTIIRGRGRRGAGSRRWCTRPRRRLSADEKAKWRRPVG